MADNSVDAVVTDPPYGLSFMGKQWDYDVPSVEIWAECLRVLKPGGHLLAFAGTRTQHRMACRIEDAGFEIRDMIAWVYGSGFPKSTDISKRIDLEENKRWLDICKALDSLPISAIMDLWKEHSKTASTAALSFAKSPTATGMNTPKSGFAPEPVLLQTSQESSDVFALVAELSSKEALLMFPEVATSSAHTLAGESESQSLAKSAEHLPKKYSPTSTRTVFAQCVAKDWLNESTASSLKAAEALKTWLGSKPSSKQEATDVLCAALTADLKHIILSQSKMYQSAGTILQTGYASAISVTTTEYMAECLISYTVDTLRKEAIDKAAGAERTEVIGSKLGRPGMAKDGSNQRSGFDAAFGGDACGPMPTDITAPATPEAQQWSGFGTALKPSFEPVIVARKLLSEKTVAANVLAHGTGAINIDGCRVDTQDRLGRTRKGVNNLFSGLGPQDGGSPPPKRWPANLIHDGSDKVIELFPNSGKGNGGKPYNYKGKEYNNKDTSMFNGDKPNAPSNFNDSGFAARYFKACPDDDLEDREIRRLFYCAKASKRDRNEGLEGFEVIISSSQLNKELSWENEERLAVLRVVMEASRPRVIDVSGVPSKSVSEWNMWLSGSESMGPCRLTTTYTTETATSLTTESKILNCFLNLLTSESMEGANFVEVFGGSPVESVEHGIQQITITSAKTESALGVEPAVLRTQLKISVNARRNNHVTVKPTALMRYLCRLVTPPGGIVLDPFMGSGSTGKAAMLEGFQFIGIEREDEYVKIAQARIEYAIATKESQDTLTETTTSDPRQLFIDDI
jgi:DNA modification methylase